jgi:putative membrane protein
VTVRRETQPERTALSWTRAALGVVAVAALIGHRAVVGGHPSLLVPAGVCALLGVALVSGVGAVRDRDVRDLTSRDEPVAAPRLAALATAVVVVVGVVAAVSVLVARLD